MGGLSLQSYVNPLKQAPWLNSLRHRQGCQHLLCSQVSLLSGSDPFWIFAMTSVIVFFAAFMGGSIQLKRGTQGKKKIGIWVIHVFSETAKVFNSLSSCWAPPSWHVIYEAFYFNKGILGLIFHSIICLKDWYCPILLFLNVEESTLIFRGLL